MHLMYRKDAEDGRKIKSDILAQNSSLKSQLASYKNYLTGIKDELEMKKDTCLQQEKLIESILSLICINILKGLKLENKKLLALFDKEKVFFEPSTYNSENNLENNLDYETMQPKILDSESINLDFNQSAVNIASVENFSIDENLLPLSAKLELNEKIINNFNIEKLTFDSSDIKTENCLDAINSDLLIDIQDENLISIKHPFCAYKNLKSICISSFKGNSSTVLKNTGQQEFFDYIAKTNSSLLDAIHKPIFLSKGSFKVMDESTLYSLIWKLIGCKLESDIVADFSNNVLF